MEADLQAENESIKLCQGIIKIAIEENDPTAGLLTEKFLEETEEHAGTFNRMLNRG